MADCFCGCGERVKLASRGANKFGHRTVGLNDKIAALLSLLMYREPMYGVNPGPTIARLKEHAADGAYYRGFWAQVVHGDEPQPPDFREERRAWYDWMKEATALTDVLSLPSEQQHCLRR